MTGKDRHFYPGGNTSVGFYSFYDSAYSDVERKYILKGGPGTGKSTLMRKIGQSLLEKGFDVEFLHCSSDNQSLDGVIVPALKLGLVDGTAPHIVEPRYPGAVDEIINLGEFWDRSQLEEHRSEIIRLTNEISATFNRAYEKFAKAKLIHDEWETCYLEGMNFNRANEITQELIENILGSLKDKGTHGHDRHLFMGAATPEGPRDYYDNLTAELETRYIIKGRPGTGKSTMLKKIAELALQKGLAVELFHCGFDPNSLDMILIPELSTALLDGTAPHVVDPSRPNDFVVDMFQCIDQAVYQKNLGHIQDVEKRYSQVMTEATAYLAAAKRLHDELEVCYVNAMDFERINAKREAIYDEILDYANTYYA